MNSLPDIARTTAAEYAMFPPGTPVVAMISGGADSMSLLHLLADGVLGPDLDLSALHINHLLRGAEADADEEFVLAECARLGVVCRTVRFDVAAYATEAGLNLEDAGRTVRYRFAAEEADARARAVGSPPSAARIAVAHTLDDRIETFVARLLSGAGAGGLASIRHVRDRIVRPLLDAPRAEVRSWLEASGFAWREDASNLDTSRMRARIRHDLLPVMLEVEPALHTTIARTMHILTEEDALLREMACAFARDFAAGETRDGEVSLDRAMLLTLSSPMRRRTVRAALESAFPELTRLDYEHVEAVVAGLEEDSFARDLPGGLRAFTEYGRMTVSRQREERPAVAPSLLLLPGSVDLADAGSITAEMVSPGSATDGRSSVVIDAGEVEMLSIGPALPGERMRPLGMEGTKKLSDLFIDAKVPRRDRHAVPVVRDGEQVVWLAGVRQSEEYKVGPHATRAVRLTWQTDR